MPQIINTNIASLTAQRNLNSSQSANNTALERLSSGLRINSAKDDAAGLAISTRFESQISGLTVAIRNAGDGISLAQTAEGALGAMTDNLQRIRELAVQSANGTNSEDDQIALQQEVEQLVAEISRTASETTFNGRSLLDGTFDTTFQIGANAGQTVDVSISELTAEKLGTAVTTGVSASGNANAIANGDLIINGIDITASKAGSDTSSTSNSAASAIAKVAAINEHSAETGVTATVDANIASGSEMAGQAGTAKISINGIQIELSTTADTAQTRAGVVEAINSVAYQTGVMAVNTNLDGGGVQLVAEDGRNIQLSVDTANLTGYDGDGGGATEVNKFLAASGLTGGLTLSAGTVYSVTKEGGYTLVADGDVGTIEITGGNGTGRGDLANAGLVAGTYERGIATTVSEEQTASTQATTLSAAGGSLTNTIDDSNDTATIFAGGSFANQVYASVTAAVTNATATDIINFRVASAGGIIDEVTLASGGTLESAISILDNVAGVDAYEVIKFTITDYTVGTAGNILYLAGQEITLLGNDATEMASAGSRLEYLVNAIGNTTFGTGVTVNAELSYARNSIDIRIQNEATVATAGSLTLAINSGGNEDASYIAGKINSGGTQVDLSAAGVGMNIVTAGSATVVHGQLAFESTLTGPVTIQAFDGTAGDNNAEFFAASYGGTIELTSYGSEALSSTSKNVVSVTVDNVAQSEITVDENTSVAELANAINDEYDAINAWEAISLTFKASNLEVADTLYLGTVASGASNGIGISITDADADGTVTLTEIADSINAVDFSSLNADVSAEVAADGNTFTLNIRNYSDSELAMKTDASGRSLQLDTNELIGSVEQQLSGTLEYAASGSQTVSLTLSNTESSPEFYTGASNTSTFTGVNGMDNGDLVINGVSIGAAQTDADTASAEYASDNTRILSSSKELSAIAVAASINAVSEETSVTAKVNATEVVGGDGSAITGANPTSGQFAVGDTAEIFINGYSAGVISLQETGAGAIDTDKAKADALDAINGISGKTGVVAVDNGVSITMTAEDGRNISVAIDDRSGAVASIGAMFGLDADNVAGIGESTFGEAPADTNSGISAESATYETTYGTITLESAQEIVVSVGNNGIGELTALGFAEGSFGGSSDGTFLEDIDISTDEGAQAAITAIDNALNTISSQRAELGALQNRFESTTSNLEITSENLSAANSRIRDADFAAETAELARTQVLQQAGISVLAQANQLPQQVLSLLG